MDSNLIILVVFIILLVWEGKFPRRADVKIETRWLANFSLSLLALAGHFIFSLLDVGSLSSSLIVINLKQTVPPSLYVPVSICLLDLLFYALHRMSHFFYILWQCHKVHHSDLEIDVSTNFRHHPLEYFWVLIVVYVFISLFGIDLFSIVIYSLTSKIIQLWHHSNIYLAENIDHNLSYVLITPRVHLIHHSIDYKQSNCNFGSVFSIWDRMFFTFLAPNKISKLTPTGVKGLESLDKQSLTALLLQPFKK